MDPTGRYLDREVSQLQFNRRVFELAADEGRPILERIGFVAISADNTDEFFQKRFARIRDRSGAEADAVRDAVREVAEHLQAAHAERLRRVLLPRLADEGIPVRTVAGCGRDERRVLERYFDDLVFPLTTPKAVDQARPFPHLDGGSVHLAVRLGEPDGGARLAYVEIPRGLPAYVPLDRGEAFVALDDLVRAHLRTLFPGLEVVASFPFRLIRNADIDLESEDADDLLESVEERLPDRRFGRAVRLEVDDELPSDLEERLVRELGVDPRDVHRTAGPLAPARLRSLCEQGPSHLRAPAWRPVTPRPLVDVTGPDELFARIRAEDILVHHPYESFDASVGALVEAAADDPDVASVKIAIYRTSEAEDDILAALERAAENGKDTVAQIELKARFEEKANIERARRLEEAGVHVVHGLLGKKIHCKVLLVSRREEDAVRTYAHVGTGNYNPRTARAYEDLGLLTSASDIGEEMGHLFDTLTGASRYDDFDPLWVAPQTMRSRLLDAIRAEADRDDGHVTFKVNNLEDEEIIDALYAASERGTRVDLVVRSICCLRPGVAGLSSRVHVRSVVGDFLEHSRIFRFGADDRARYFVGSADLMNRNMDDRVEAVTPIRDPRLRGRLDAILEVYLADDVLAWTLGPDGTWRPPPARVGTSTHHLLKSHARRREAR